MSFLRKNTNVSNFLRQIKHTEKIKDKKKSLKRTNHGSSLKKTKKTPNHLKLMTDAAEHQSKSSHFFQNYASSIFHQEDRIPFDVLYPVFSSVCDSSNLEQKMFCPRCYTPWKMGFNKPRLLKRLKLKDNPLIKALLRKDEKKVKKLKESEKLRLKLYRSQRNTLEVKCLVCKEKSKVHCSFPGGEKKSLEILKGKRGRVANDLKRVANDLEMDSSTNKKKKKKKGKEMNAGLLIALQKETHPKEVEAQRKSNKKQPQTQIKTHQKQPQGDKPKAKSKDPLQLENVDDNKSEQNAINSNVTKRVLDTIPDTGKLASKNKNKNLNARRASLKSKHSESEKNTDRNSEQKTDLRGFLSSLI